MSSDVAIRVDRLSKNFQIYEKPEHRLMELVSFGRITRHREFAALKDVSLEIRRGETVGIVGRNGCGKSTLLQVICGILQPSAGTVETHGRIAALLELGAGFDGNFSGRENVYLNGAIHGRTRAEMDERFEAIAAFADIGEFIDRPVKTYSSGMFVRLAFATAVNVDPDILVVDEALAVGDEAFQRKCFARIEQIKERGATILFVSHAAQTIIQLCDRAVLMDTGEKLMEGPPKDVVHAYHRRLYGLVSQGARDAEPVAQSDLTKPALEGTSVVCDDSGTNEPPLNSPNRSESVPAGGRIEAIALQSHNETVHNLHPRRFYSLRISFLATSVVKNIAFEFIFKSTSGAVVAGMNTAHDSNSNSFIAFDGENIYAVFNFYCNLSPGTYYVSATVRGLSDECKDDIIHKKSEDFAVRVLPTSHNALGLADLNATYKIYKNHVPE